MKYIIELTPIEGTDLYRAKGANTLVFDENGIKNILTPYKTKRVKRWETYNGDFVKAQAEFNVLCKKEFAENGCSNCSISCAHCFGGWLMQEVEE